jgi:MFS transporter, DHA1 family, tetracycline resistance protein
LDPFSAGETPGTTEIAGHQTNKKGSLGLIFFVMLMDIIGITILSPVAPKLVLRYSSSALVVTLITVVYAAGQFVAAPVLGKIGDRYGRRPVLLISLVGQAAGYFLFGIGGSLWILILGRLIGGITSGNLSTSGAYIADISKPEERTKNFALISVAWSMGLILGPALGGIFGQFSLETPAFVAGAASLVNVLLGIFLLPESLPKERRERTPLRIRDLDPIHSIFEMARRPALGLVLLVYGLFSFAFNGVNGTSSLFMIQKFAAETWQLSAMMMMAGLSIALTNSFLVPVWTPRLGEKVISIYSLVGLAVVYIGVLFSPLMWLAFVVNMLASVMSSFIFPAMTTLSIECVSHQEAGKLMGVSTAVASLMNILGPLGAGLAYDHITMGAPFWMGSLILVLTALVLTRAAPRSPQIARAE